MLIIPVSQSLLEISCLLLASALPLSAGRLAGIVRDPQDQPVAGCTVLLDSRAAATTNDNGEFALTPLTGPHTLTARCEGFSDAARAVQFGAGDLRVDLRLALAVDRQSITVKAAMADAHTASPDPAARTYIASELLPANPARPGMPLSIPGLPGESASGGIKAPQYFAPGVAGDHGEPIAQFFQVGTLLVPNNLSANAHGNGYADPNIVIPAVIESVELDGGSFNMREGNHAVDLSAVYGIRSRLEPFIAIAGDPHDIDISAAWSPFRQDTRAWLAIEAAFGNGLLDTPEHRRQYKLNGYRVFDVGAHELTLLGIGYFGESKLPGLVPLDIPHLRDTIDPRQRDQTHTSEAALDDTWRLNSAEVHSGAFFRTYNLSLYSNFGDGLIRQSEFRTVTGGRTEYLQTVRRVRFIAGMEYLRDAPRRLELDRYDSTDPSSYGPFTNVTENNVTLSSLAHYAAIDGAITAWLRYDLSFRRDEIKFDNAGLLNPANSFHRWLPVNSPKATLSLVPPDTRFLPSVAFSFGQSFFTNDPRIGTGTTAGTLVTRAHAAQVVARRTIAGTELRVTLGRITQEQSLAKIDPDTGLQINQGPSRNRFFTVSALHRFGSGVIQASYSKADARDLQTGVPLPEAPRTLFDVWGALDRLPFHLAARAEYEQVGRTPLGDNFSSVPVKEFRGALTRPFLNGRIDAGVQFQIARGFTGQTTEVLALPREPQPFERVTGVYLPSYVSLSFSYHFRRR